MDVMCLAVVALDATIHVKMLLLGYYIKRLFGFGD
jgi:hypothetical protein